MNRKSKKLLIDEYPEIAKQFHPTKNGSLQVESLTPFSHKKIWWLCPIKNNCGCPHEWQTSVGTRSRGCGCVYCNNKLFCIHESIKYNFPFLMTQWNHEKNSKIDPAKTSINSNKKVWWVCRNSDCGCLHEWQACIYDRCKMPASKTDTPGCPYCYGRYVCKHNSLAYKLPDILKEWNYDRNRISPETVSIKSNVKVWWKCSNGHEWKANIDNRIIHESGCPKCVKSKNYSKESIKWLNTLADKHNITIRHAESPDGEFTIPTTKFRPDGYCKSLNILFEYHGCFWHGCIKCYKNRELINPVTKLTMCELHNKTLAKKNMYFKKGYKVVEIWDCEWKEHKKNLSLDIPMNIQTKNTSYDDFTVYVGFDSRNFGQMMAFEVCRKSIVQHYSRPVEVRQLIRKKLQAMKLYQRKEDPLASTEFTYSRFLVPYLNNYNGWALFCDSDFLWTNDVWKIFDYVKRDPNKAVYCVQHDIKSTGGLKMNGLAQANYPRKNWSSMMLFNCSHPSCRKLNVETVANETPAWLHRMAWADDSEIGAIPHKFNYLVEYYHDMGYADLPVAIHYTEGGPWHPGYETCEFGDLWLAYLTPEECDRLFAEREDLRREMEQRYSKEELDKKRDASQCQT